MEGFNFSPLLALAVCAIMVNLPLFFAAWFFVLKNSQLALAQIINTILYILVVYNALSYSYFHIFNMGDTGRRIRILYELKLSGPLKYNYLDSKYNVKVMIDARLERLIAMKQVRRDREYFVLASFFLYCIGAVVLKWGYFLRFNPRLKAYLENDSF